MSINELFGNEHNEQSASARTLSGTTELTRVAHNVAVRIIRQMDEQIDVYRERIATSAKDYKEMDTLLDEFKPWTDIEEDSILRHLDDETVEGMLKSQQSKRSRLKAKAMTVDNYTNLMTATIAEGILRDLYDKPKSVAFGTRRANSLEYTEEELEALKADQEALRKEIRNVQSKKSIMKSKADFDETSEHWQALLKAEQMLKEMRIGGGTTIVEVDRTKERLIEMLSEVNVDSLKAADSKEILNAIRGMVINAED